VGKGTQAGVVTNYNPKDAQSTVGGKVLNYAPYRGSGFLDAATANAVNNEGTALLDVYGRMYDFQLSDASKGNYALIVNHGQDNYSVNSSPVVKIFDKDGNEGAYGLTSSVRDTHWYKGQAPYADPHTNGIASDINWYMAFGTHPTNAGRAREQDLYKLIRYKISGSSLSDVAFGVNVVKSNKDNDYAVVNKAGSIIKIYSDPESGNQAKDYLIDSGTVVFIVNKYGDYSLGSINDVKDATLENPLQYMLDPNTKKIRALVVNEDDAGANNVFVMISNITYQSDGAGGEVAQVDGLLFGDGVGAVEKTWATNVTLSSFVSRLNALRDDGDTNTKSILTGDVIPATPTTPELWYRHGLPYTDATPNFYWFEMVKFRIDEDNVLKADYAGILGEPGGGSDTDPESGYMPNDRITGAKVGTNEGTGVYYLADYMTGADRTFQFWYNATTSAAVTGGNEFAVFDNDAVFYSINSIGRWVASKATHSSFVAQGKDARYILLKTDPEDFAFDVIIRVDNLRLREYTAK
jgi:hypothetical protein